MKRRFHSCPSPNKNENTNSARYELVSDSTTHAHYPFSISTSSSSISSFDDCEDRSVSHHEDTMERLIFEGLELVLDGAQAIENTIECHLSEYMKKREMTSAQEQANAITILPNVVYCLYFLLSGSWLSDDRIEASGNMEEIQWLDLGGNVPAKSSFFSKRCLASSLFPHLYATPPLPLIAIAFGICIHAPFSMIYHWEYARKLPPGFSRINHWSRRFDHAFIHVCTTFLSYGTTGRQDVFWVNLIYNLDCVYRQFEKKVQPGRNKIRILIALFGFTLPMLSHGDIEHFISIWVILVVSGWFFVSYPIGGWSHAAFHLILCFLPPVLMHTALHLPAAEVAFEVATKCAMLSTK